MVTVSSVSGHCANAHAILSRLVKALFGFALLPGAACKSHSLTGYPNTVMATIPVGGGPSDLALLPKGDFAYVANGAAQYVTAVNVEARTDVARITCVANPYMITVKPGGEFYVTSELDDAVAVIRTNDNAGVATVPVGMCPHRLCFRPDGAYCYTANQNSNTVSVIRTSDNVGDAPFSVQASANGAVHATCDHDSQTITRIGRT
jgi:YVTN family beta-propeller protein